MNNYIYTDFFGHKIHCDICDDIYLVEVDWIGIDYGKPDEAHSTIESLLEIAYEYVRNNLLKDKEVIKEDKDPTQEEIQAEILLNQAEILANQQSQDEVLAELLLNSLEVSTNV